MSKIGCIAILFLAGVVGLSRAIAEEPIRSETSAPSTVRDVPSQPPQSDAPSSGTKDILKLFGLALPWAVVIIQLLVLPFYQKGEKLHKDYSASGAINSAIAAIESDQLISSLARMFKMATDQQEDKRRRPENEIEELLQSVRFLPDLQKARDAMSLMDGVQQQYMRLKLSASRLWRTGLTHAIASLMLPTIHAFLVPLDERWEWLFWGMIAVWLISLTMAVWGFVRFHAQIEQFNALLENHSVEVE